MIIKKSSIFNFQFSIPAKRSGGFTLVELLVAVSLFVVVATISIGAILSVFNANKKAQSSKTVVDNFNLSIENMSRTVRFGNNYHCGVSGTISVPSSCPGGDTFFAVTFNGSVVVYRLNGTAIQKSDDGGVNYTDITDPAAVIEYLKFYVFGTTVSDNDQPYVVVVIKGKVGNKVINQTTFSIETLMSQRSLDL
ncbi:MAG: type II secretion system protein [Candidatus Paceibacterota bacterium]|jgi:prepilin-type N-terminal cleavage/methylation domain-containing protein